MNPKGWIAFQTLGAAHDRLTATRRGRPFIQGQAELFASLKCFGRARPRCPGSPSTPFPSGAARTELSQPVVNRLSTTLDAVLVAEPVDNFLSRCPALALQSPLQFRLNLCPGHGTYPPRRHSTASQPNQPPSLKPAKPVLDCRSRPIRQLSKFFQCMLSGRGLDRKIKTLSAVRLGSCLEQMSDCCAVRFGQVNPCPFASHEALFISNNGTYFNIISTNYH